MGFIAGVAAAISRGAPLLGLRGVGLEGITPPPRGLAFTIPSRISNAFSFEPRWFRRDLAKTHDFTLPHIRFEGQRWLLGGIDALDAVPFVLHRHGAEALDHGAELFHGLVGEGLGRGVAFARS